MFLLKYNFVISVVILIEIAWLAMGIVWLKEFYMDCPIAEAKEVMFGKQFLLLLIFTYSCLSFCLIGRSNSVQFCCGICYNWHHLVYF